MKAKQITTNYRQSKKIKTEKEILFQPESKGVEFSVVNLYPEKTYQTFDGFGGALTESSGFVLSQMGEQVYHQVIESYYGQEGIGYRFGRIPLDSCDFSLGNYAAVEDQNDVDFKTFSLSRDAKYIQPLIRKVQSALGKTKLTLMLTPWSPPGFMKDTGIKNCGGKLLKKHYADWARYICRYIMEYQKLGVIIDYLSIQNEPFAATPWDSCQYSAQEEKEFLRDNLYPQLQENKLTDIKILIWDHNKERIYERSRETIDADTDKMIDGVAFHWYTGDHFDALDLTHESFPDKKLIHSEGCVEYSRLGQNDHLLHAQKYAHDIIGNLNAGMTAYIDWNIVLDERGGPNHVDNFCSAPVMCNLKTGEVEYRLTFDYISHFSRYIVPGSKRMAYSKYTPDLEMTAFVRPDYKWTAVFLNRSLETVPFSLRVNGKITSTEIEAQSIATIVIEP